MSASIELPVAFSYSEVMTEQRWTSTFVARILLIGVMAGGAVFATAGCASLQSGRLAENPAAGAPAESASTETQPLPAEEATASERAAIAKAERPTGDLSDSGEDLSAIPLEVNRMVLKWIDYFQGSGRVHMERYLSRSTRYMPIMKKILKEEGLPEDLIYIALIESGFSGTARSHANAVGYWQFIRGTGKRYGLQIDNFVDERRDFVLATRAAADYFKGLYNLFGAWYLAIASYNVGENRIKNLVMRYHTRDFWRLARENKLPRETIDYVPKFLAARLIAKNPERYGFSDVDYMPALDFREIELAGSADLRRLASSMGLDYDDLRDLNPAFKRGVAVARRRTGGKVLLRVPPGQEAAALAALPQATVNAKTRLAASDEDYSYHRVRRGETLSSIARKFGVSQSALAQLNGISTSARLVSGRRIRVPAEVMPARTRRSPQSRQGPRSSISVNRTSRVAKIHIVRRGETLSAIASRYGVKPSTLATKNRIRNRSNLHAGRRLTIPGSSAAN